jgi:hypothetical protein
VRFPEGAHPQAGWNCIPFGSLGDEGTPDDKGVYDSKRAGEPVNRPEGVFTDQEWALVARMVDNNPDNRPTAAELVQLMSEQQPVKVGE